MQKTQTDPLILRYIQNSLIQVAQEARTERFKKRGQGSRQRDAKRASKAA